MDVSQVRSFGIGMQGMPLLFVCSVSAYELEFRNTSALEKAEKFSTPAAFQSLHHQTFLAPPLVELSD